MPIKGRSRALLQRVGRAGKDGTTLAQGRSLPPTWTLVTPYCKRTRPRRGTNTKAAGFTSHACLPPASSPLHAPSRADPSGLGHAATIYSSVQGPPGFETPTVGAPGRGLLRVDEQLPVKLQMGSLQQPFQPETVLRFGNLEFLSLDGSYDMVLLPPPRDSDNGGRQPARRRRNRRRLPHVVEEQHSGLPHPLPRRRRRRRGNQGQAGGGTSSAVERVDGAGAPTGGTSGIDLASETKMSTVSPQHANPKQTDDASTLVKELLGVTLVPKTTVQSVPDVTSSPLVDQEVPTDSHLAPFGFSLDPPSDFALVDALIEASPNPLKCRMQSPWDRLTAVSTYGPSGSEEDDEPDFCWDFSILGNPNAMRDFMTACDYCLSDCSDGSRSLGDEDCGPSRECFHVDLRGPDEGNHLGMPENGDLPRPVPRVDILRELAVVPVPAGGHDPQLEQIREMEARLDEGAGTLEPIRRDIGQEWAGQPLAGEVHHLPQGFQHHIADDVRVRPPPTSNGVGQNLAAAAILLRVMPEPSTTEGRRIQGELKNLLEDVAVQRAESSASRRQGCPSEHRAATS
jgi:hypothetical protein